MRLAIVTEYFYPTLGGVQEHVFHFAREVRRRGHEATVITSAVPGAPSLPPAIERNVIRLGRSVSVDSNGSVGRVTIGLDLRQRLTSLLVPERFDLVHVHVPLAPVLPMLAVRHTSLPVVATHHTNFTRSRLMSTFRSVCQGLVNRMDANIAVSQACVRAIGPYIQGDFHIVPNGVDCGFFANGRRQRWAAGAMHVLFVGRLEARCGLDRLLEAWPMIEQRQAQLLVLGDGPDRGRFEAQAERLEVPARFLGAVRDARPNYFATADVLVCPTVIASFGITLLEGMAAGLPIVASNIDGFRDIVTHGREGLLVDTSQPALLAAAIDDLLSNPEKRRALGEQGRQTAAGYDWSKVTERVFDVYRSIGVTA
jgi:phosphatidylinositol alpha-mannosyltransferase